MTTFKLPRILLLALALASAALIVVPIASAATTVTSVAVPANATYIAGQNLDFDVTFGSAVTVDTSGGTPYIGLTIGSSTVHAAYLSGSGTTDLIFRYTVQSGDLDTDGITVASAITLNGGTIQDTGVDVDPTLNSVGSTAAVDVDAVAPVVSSVSAPANGSYPSGGHLDFTVHFSENVTVTGTPQLGLTVGSSSVTADYLSGSGTNALVFRYTVQPGDTDTDGVAVGALGLNGGTIEDAATNNANLTLNNVGSTASVLVDTTAPTVSSVSVPANATYGTGKNLDFTVHFSENVTVTGSPRIALTVGSATVYATYHSGSGTSAIVFRYTVQSGDTDADGIAIGALTLNSGTINDAATNAANLTLNSVGATTGVLVDTTSPTVSSVAVPANGTYGTSKNLDFTVTFSRAVTVTGTPEIALTIGTTTKYATYLSGSGSTTLTFRYTVAAGDADADGISVGALSLNSGTINDAYGNAATLTLNSVGVTTGVLVSTTGPTVSSISVPSNGTYKIGDNLNFTVTFSSAVTVTGTPEIAITIGSTTKYATYVSGSGSTTLTFRYTVVSGDADKDGIAVGALSLNSGTINDANGNPATLTFSSIPSTAAVLVDGSVAAPPDTTAPSKPAKVSAKITKNGQLYLNFAASSDNQGVTGYQLTVAGKVVATFTATSHLFSFSSLLKKPGKLVITLQAFDAAGNQSAAVTITLTRAAAPRGTPKKLPAWATKFKSWQALKHKKGHHRPKTPKHIPAWYAKWVTWQKTPVKVTVG